MPTSEVAEERNRDWEEQTRLYVDMDPDYVGVDQRKRYQLEDPEWRFDKIPEIMDGKNISDFWSDDLEEKYEILEREELVRLRKLEQEIMAQAQFNEQFKLTPEQEAKVQKIREKRAMIILKSREKKTNGSTPWARGTAARNKTYEQLEEHLSSIGLNGAAVINSIKEDPEGPRRSRSKSLSRSVSRGAGSESRVGRKRSRSEMERSMSVTPGEGFSNVRQKLDAERMAKKSTRKLSQDGRLGESDRHVFDLKPKHLYSGKMDFKKDRR
jgi:nucleolar GTP-binding protein